MLTTNAKAIFNEAEVYRAAREMRAQAFAAVIRGAAHGVSAFVTRTIIEPLRARARRHRQLEELMHMDDHMLRDLGLSRGGIAYAFEHGRDAEPANTNTPLDKPHAA